MEVPYRISRYSRLGEIHILYLYFVSLFIDLTVNGAFTVAEELLSALDSICSHFLGHDVVYRNSCLIFINGCKTSSTFLDQSTILVPEIFTTFINSYIFNFGIILDSIAHSLSCAVVCSNRTYWLPIYRSWHSFYFNIHEGFLSYVFRVVIWKKKKEKKKSHTKRTVIIIQATANEKQKLRQTSPRRNGH